MSEPVNHRPDELVTRAIEALKDVSVVEGPFPEIIARTISAAVRAANAPQPTLARRIHDMPLKYKALVGTLAASVAIVFALLISDDRSLALGQVVEKLSGARRLSFLVEQHSTNPRQPLTKTRVWIMEPDKMRRDWTAPQGAMVLVRNGAKTLRLDLTEKTAVVGELPPPARNTNPLGMFQDALGDLHSVVEKDARSLGEKLVEGVKAKGFEAVINNHRITIWANASSGVPIRVEYTPIDVAAAHGLGLKVLSDFKFDEQVDANLFSVDVPAGYRVLDSEPLPPSPLDDVVAVLRFYSERVNGEFPVGLEGETIATKLGLPKEPDAMAADQKEFAGHLDRAMRFLKPQRTGRDFQYYPGVKMGDKERVVFWCVVPLTGTVVGLVPNPKAASPPDRDQSPRDKFLVVYGDLRIEEKSKEQLPAGESK